MDNGSTDGSPIAAARRGAEVVVAPQRGYGAACAAKLRHSTAEVVVVLNCDASVDAAEVPRLIKAVLRGELDLVIGRRILMGRGGYPLDLRIANRELARRTGTVIQDCGPVRVARRRTLLNLDLRDQRSGYPAVMVVKAAAAGHRIAQVPVSYRARTGRSKVTGAPLGIWRAVRDSSAALQ